MIMWGDSHYKGSEHQMTFNKPSSTFLLLFFQKDKWNGKTYHIEYTLKNFITKVDAVAFGYTWQILATSMAHDTPPKKPSMLE